MFAYHPKTHHLIHAEASIDPYKWEVRKERFAKKFQRGEDWIFEEVSPWLEKDRPKIDRWAVLWASDAKEKTVGKGKVIPIWKLYNLIAHTIRRHDKGNVNKGGIPERYPLLRAIQHTIHWYSEPAIKELIEVQEWDAFFKETNP